MNGICISFYLKTGRIHIFSQALRCIESPKRVCFLLAQDGQVLMMRAHENRDFISHKIPREVYEGKRSFEISSYNLCRILADIHGWDLERSYRVPGRVAENINGVLFFLDRAEYSIEL